MAKDVSHGLRGNGQKTALEHMGIMTGSKAAKVLPTSDFQWIEQVQGATERVVKMKQWGMFAALDVSDLDDLFGPTLLTCFEHHAE